MLGLRALNDTLSTYKQDASGDAVQVRDVMFDSSRPTYQTHISKHCYNADVWKVSLMM